MTTPRTATVGTISTGTENKVIADLAQRAVEAESEPFDIIPDRLVGLIVNGTLHTFDEEDYADRPRRQTGQVKLTDQDSFASYVNRHKDETATTLWSNVDAGTVTAVLNDHSNGIDVAAHGDHRAMLTVKTTDEWNHWIGRDNKQVPQVDFAEHIEEGAGSITVPEDHPAAPDAATMLEVALHFQARRNIDFKSSQRLESGEVAFRYEEQIDGKVGQGGSIEIPGSFFLKLQVFQGGNEHTVEARLRYRITEGRLTIGYKLVRPAEVKRKAFEDLTSSISTDTGLDVFAGTPRP